MINLQKRWNDLADALREEFQEYGGVLCLLNEQQNGIVKRDLDSLAEKNLAIEEQIQTANGLRIRRERLAEEIAVTSGQQSKPLKELITCAPGPVKPMFEALIDGADQVIEKIQRKTEQNRQLLARATDVNNEILMKLQPQKMTRTYNRLGGVTCKSAPVKGRGLNLSA